jgi:hypothetical protein
LLQGLPVASLLQGLPVALLLQGLPVALLLQGLPVLCMPTCSSPSAARSPLPIAARLHMSHCAMLVFAHSIAQGWMLL